MSSDRVAVSAHGLTKKYRIYAKPIHRLLQRLAPGRYKFFKEVAALDDINFEIRRGEAVGIIGRNGSGKSTLLQLICGILKPSAGQIEVNGRVSALLELGAGFHPEFTGRENVYMQGAIMGFSRQQMEERFAAIEAFAEIGHFIEQPVKTYSSGMFLRLAFSVAINVEPEILIIDEALAVGDALFQKRCHARLRQMHQSGLTLIFVSHDHELVRTLTGRALLLDQGKQQFWGDTAGATHRYRKMLFEREAADWARLFEHAAQPQAMDTAPDGHTYGIGGARILGLRILDMEGEPQTCFQIGDRMDFEIAVQFESPLAQLNISIVIRTLQGLKVYSWGTFNQDICRWAGADQGEIFWNRSFEAGENAVVRLTMDGNLGAGSYEVQVVVSRELEKQYGSQQVLHWRDEMGFFKVVANPQEYIFGGVCDLHGKAVF